MATESAGGRPAIEGAIEGLRRTVRAVAWLLRASLIAAAALMLACIAIQVVMRYVFGRTPSWSEEVAILMFAWITLGGLALGSTKASMSG
jgi:TRAP-type C4-dicarboxylate transport system permease small subunit